MLWQVTIASIGLRPELDWEGRYLNQEGKATRRDSVFFTLLYRTSTAQREPVDQYSSRLSRLASATTGSPFWVRKPIFFYSFLL